MERNFLVKRIFHKYGRFVCQNLANFSRKFFAIPLYNHFYGYFILVFV
jgi:hypothetical protein